jgi:hypothetical protein
LQHKLIIRLTQIEAQGLDVSDDFDNNVERGFVTITTGVMGRQIRMGRFTASGNTVLMLEKKMFSWRNIHKETNNLHEQLHR